MQVLREKGLHFFYCTVVMMCWHCAGLGRLTICFFVLCGTGVCIVFQNHDSFLLPLFPSKYGRSGVCIIEMHGMATEPVKQFGRWK